MDHFLRNVRERAKIMGVATFECRPQNVEGITSDGGRMVGIRSKRTVDSQDWVPEVPDMIGIYHSFVRGHNRDTRVHKLFIIVSGGCGKAADEFYNTVLDCHGHATARDCVTSEEVCVTVEIPVYHHGNPVSYASEAGLKLCVTIRKFFFS